MYAVPNRFVSSPSLVSSVAGDPLLALETFAQSTYPGVWPQLNKEVLLQEIQSRLNHPQTIAQDTSSLGGPVSVMFDLLHKNPYRYVRLCHSLFETGGFQTLKRRVQASERLRQSTPSSPMQQVDWMLLSTLYETELSLFPMPSFMPQMPNVIKGLEQLTKPWELMGWLRELVGYSHVTYHHAQHLWSSDWKLMRRVTNAIAQGGVAIALMAAEPLLRGQVRKQETARRRSTPDCWMTIANISPLPSWYSIGINLNRIQLALLSGNPGTGNLAGLLRINQPTFQRHCWGIVIGTP